MTHDHAITIRLVTFAEHAEQVEHLHDLLMEARDALAKLSAAQAAQESKDNDFELRWDGHLVKGDPQSIEAVRAAVKAEQEPRYGITIKKDEP